MKQIFVIYGYLKCYRGTDINFKPKLKATLRKFIIFLFTNVRQFLFIRLSLTRASVSRALDVTSR